MEQEEGCGTGTAGALDNVGRFLIKATYDTQHMECEARPGGGWS